MRLRITILIFLFFQIIFLLLIFIKKSNYTNINPHEYLDIILNDDEVYKQKLIDSNDLIGIDISWIEIDNNIYYFNQIFYDQEKNVLYHNLNNIAYSDNNNIYGIQISFSSDSGDTLLMKYSIGPSKVGFLNAYFDENWKIKKHNFGYH